MPNRRSQQHIYVIGELRRVLPFYKIKEEYHIGDRLFLDIYVPRLMSAIEVNGKQHYCFSKFLHKNYSAFELSKFLDAKKAAKCIENGIGLYIVKYDDIFDVIDFIDFAKKHLLCVGGN